MPNTEEILVVGQIGAAYGIKGWVHVRSFTDPPSNLIHYSPWFVSRTAESNDRWQEVQLLGAHRHNKGLVAQLTLADDRTQAEELKGLNIGVSRESFPALEEDSFLLDRPHRYRCLHADRRLPWRVVSRDRDRSS